MNEEWRTDIIRWNKISLETAELYLGLAEKRLDETVETAKNISDKNEKLLTLCISLITLILSYISVSSWKLVGVDYFITTLVVMISFLLVQLWFLVRNIMVFKIGTKGEEPKYILTENFVGKQKKNEQYLNLVLHVCEIYQNKINCNHTVNAKRNNRLVIAIYLFIGLPISFLLALGCRLL
ncbi:hypothetical protein QLS91_08535 [Flavobacterium sp. LB2P84]|uniref:Uncharacterized protein n=1 Tax=Flavobacterium zhoui TaxID=3230414 RepID=A0ABW6I0S6_9FLAO|nr:hypothetical protein [Flavobacterium yafengii]MDI6033117.1 hypothetical protein [Flavobacterium yafengii]